MNGTVLVSVDELAGAGAVLLTGEPGRRHVFVHGFTSVPYYPASHGCIRLPLTGGNPAKFFYEWTDTGTPVKVTRS